ncbi:MAG: protein translocase subunit SecD [bacterium]|nr:protein translocase subunit SecD [bacterium]
MKKLSWRIVLIGIVVLMSLFLIYPSIRWGTYKTAKRSELAGDSLSGKQGIWKEEERNLRDAGTFGKFVFWLKKWYQGNRDMVINLGLDLKGGMDVTLQVRTKEKEVSPEVVDRTLEVIRNRVDGMGVSEPEITKQGTDRISVKLPGLKDPKRALDLIGKTAKMEFRLVAEDSLVESTLAKLSELKDLTAYINVETKRTGEGVSFIELDIADDDLVFVSKLLAGEEAHKFLPEDYEFLFQRKENLHDRKRALFLVRKEPAITGDMLLDAVVRFDNMYQPYVSLEFSSAGNRRLASVSGIAESKYEREKTVTRLGIVLDNVVYSAPLMKVKILRNPIIEGSFTKEEANDLRIVLKSGALPANVDLMGIRVVGPSLGSDSIRKGIKSALLGLSIVMVFMLVYYMFSGLVANFALLLNMLIIFAALVAFGGTLTLPGIAGIILTIGMAVDANVLIFERIREEMDTGRQLRTAIVNGYNKAFLTIFDANLTTFITALILFVFGTGPVKGFAVVLMIGIAASMFTALFGTRTFFEIMMKIKKFHQLHMLRFFSKPNIDFVGKRMIAYCVSLVFIIVGMGVFISRGSGNLGIDFTSGSETQIQFSKKVEIEDIRKALSGENFPGVQVQSYTDKDTGKWGVFIKTSSDESSKISEEILAVMSRNFPDAAAELEGYSYIGPVVSKDLKRNALIAIFLSLIAIVIYIWFRFGLRFGIAAVTALIHDVFITLGMFAIFGRLITLPVVAAILTLIGYSLNDTIVVFDRIREDLKVMRKASYKDILNASINQTLSRTVLTSLTTLVVVICLYVFGGENINDFAFALMVGVVVGTYSSIFVASALLFDWYKKGHRA